MDFQREIDLLSSQLNIPNDKFNQIIGTICRNFVKKYERHTQINADMLSNDLRKVTKEIQIYSQYVCETISKYKSLNKLETLVRSIIEGQSMILTYVQNIICQQLQERNKFVKKIESMTGRIYQRCQNCAKPLKMAEIKNVQDEIGLRFRDIHQYFQHDLDQINKLSEEASLIYRKKALNIEGIAEELYMEKFQKMQQNISTTIQHVTHSLNNITVFQQRFNEMQQYQIILAKNQKQNINNQTFNSKKYAVEYSKHFYGLIKKLEDKLNKIKTYFIITVNEETQTINQFNQCTPQKIKQLKQQLIKVQVQKKQLQIYVASLQQQLAETKIRSKLAQQNLSKIRMQKQKSDEKIKYLEAELEILSKREAYRRKSLQSSQKIIQVINNLSDQKSKQTATNIKNTGKNNNQIQQIHENQCGDEIVQNGQMYDSVSSYSRLINQTFNQTRSKRQSKASNSLRKEQGYFQKQNRTNLQLGKSTNSGMGHSLRPRDTIDEPNVYQNAKKIAESQLVQQAKIIEKPIIKKLRQTKMMEKINYLEQKQQSKTSIKKQSQNNIISNTLQNKFKHVKVFQVKIASTKKDKRQKIKTKNNVAKMIAEKITTQRSQKSLEKNKQNHHFRFFQINDQLEQIYKTLKNNENVKINEYVNYKQFKSKFNEFMQQIIGKPQNIDNFLATQYIETAKPKISSQLIKTHTKMKRSINIKQNEQLMKVTQKQKKRNKKGFSGPITQQNDRLDEQKQQTTINKRSRIQKININTFGSWSKTNTESNCDQGLLKIKETIRKSSNTIDEDAHPKILMKLQKFNGFSSTDSLFNNKNFIENLPTLKKKYRQQSVNFNSRKSAVLEEQIDIPIEQFNSYEFNQQDIKLVYHSIENAYEIGQTSLKHKKTQSCILKDQDSLTTLEINYMKIFFTKMANIHLVNKQGYQNIKMFLICPYDSIISQMTQLNLIKSGSYSNAMRQSLRKILLLHRNCSTKGQLCKHLRHLIGKVVYFERIKQGQE